MPPRQGSLHQRRCGVPWGHHRCGGPDQTRSWRPWSRVTVSEVANGNRGANCRKAAGGSARVSGDNEGVSEARRGYQRSAGGLAGAIVMSLLLISAIWALRQISGGEAADPAPTIDYTQSLTEARRNASFEVLAPEVVPPGWRATTARWEVEGDREVWHLGFVIDGDTDYVGLDQRTEPEKDALRATTPADQPKATVSVGGVTWKTFTTSDEDESALVLPQDGVTTIVSGTASETVLRGFAESLSPE